MHDWKLMNRVGIFLTIFNFVVSKLIVDKQGLKYSSIWVLVVPWTDNVWRVNWMHISVLHCTLYTPLRSRSWRPWFQSSHRMADLKRRSFQPFLAQNCYVQFAELKPFCSCNLAYFYFAELSLQHWPSCIVFFLELTKRVNNLSSLLRYYEEFSCL